MNKGACWKSDLNLSIRDDETQSQTSTVENCDDPKETPVGPFMHNLFERQLYTDVEFAFKNTQECLSAHRVVLAAKSEFFARLLFGEKTSDVRGMKMRVDISFVQSAVFKNIVNYFYTDEIDFPNLSTVLDIYKIANSFSIQSLLDLCEQYTDELELTEDNACSTLQLSNSKSAENLKKRCIDYIKNHALEVISSPDFEKCSYSTVREIADLQDLDMRSESEMLEAVTRWINIQPEHAKAELRKSLMKCIRFLSFTPSEFHGVIKQHPELLTSAEALDTLIYLNDPTEKNIKGIPDWMNKSRRTFLQGQKNSKLQEVKLDSAGTIEIPLTATSQQNNFACLTSSLQLRCIKGEHKISGVTVKLEEISNDGNMIGVMVVKALVKGLSLYFSKTINSKEAAIQFTKGFAIHSGQAFNLEVEFNCCQPCKFFKYDKSKKDLLSNEHFQCSIASKPKQGRHYFLHEVLFETQTQKSVAKMTNQLPVKLKNRQKKKKKAKLIQTEKESSENKQPSTNSAKVQGV